MYISYRTVNHRTCGRAVLTNLGEMQVVTGCRPSNGRRLLGICDETSARRAHLCTYIVCENNERIRLNVGSARLV